MVVDANACAVLGTAGGVVGNDEGEGMLGRSSA